MYLFHGGCHRCTMQKEVGVDFCINCQNFLPDWNLPDYNNEKPTESEKMKAKLILKHKVKHTNIKGKK